MVPLRIVVCDESAQVRDQIKAIARMAKADVVEAETGHQALAALMVSDAQCAFIHVHLPEISGFEVVRRVRAALHVCPVLVGITGWMSLEDDAMFSAVGFDKRIARPIDATQVADVLAMFQR